MGAGRWNRGSFTSPLFITRPMGVCESPYQTPFGRASIPIIHKIGIGEMSGSKERNVGNDLGNWGRILLANLSIHS